MAIWADLQTLAVHDGFKRLFTVRFLSQCADGFFHVGLASLYFFNPTHMTSAAGVAAAFTVLLLPFTIVGPVVGPLLDRWSRQRVLLIGNAIRALLCTALAGLIMTGASLAIISVVGLVTLGINRFLLSALSAGLPHVVPRPQLLMANTVSPTLGAVSVAVGALAGFVINRLAPVGVMRDAINLGMAALVLVCACWAATRIARDELGPDRVVDSTLRDDIGAVVRDLVDGGRYLIARGTPGYALVVMAMHRFLYGINFIALLLISRNLLSDPADSEAGLATFALLSGLSFVGNGLAIVATPIAHERMRPSRWILVCLGISLVSQLTLVFTHEQGLVGAAAILMGLGVQGAKIAVDTIVQRDTHDHVRGRTFALYDMGFNLAFVAAAIIAALSLPDTGWSPLTFAVLAAIYVALGAWYLNLTRKVADEPNPV